MAIPRASSRRFPILLTATLICVTSLPVFAQTPEQQPAPKVTEEMVVTARKREESPQEVPMSIVAPTMRTARLPLRNTRAFTEIQMVCPFGRSARNSAS